MKITRVSATTHDVPVDVPLLKEPAPRAIAFVTVETDVGITGYGLTTGSRRIAIKESINRELGPSLIATTPSQAQLGRPEAA